MLKRNARFPCTPVLNSNAKSQLRSLTTTLCTCQHSFEPRTEPALGFLCALEHLLVELVYGRVDFSAGAVELALCLGLCLLVLLPGLDAVLVELLLGLLCLMLCLVRLPMSAMRFCIYYCGDIHIVEQLSALPRNLPRQLS
jgi:hypothetical protein